MVKFQLLHGYLDRNCLKEESSDALCNQFLSITSDIKNDKIECYFGSLQNNSLIDVFRDHLVLIKIEEGFRPIIIKRYTSVLNYCFKFYNINYDILDEESIYEQEFIISQKNIEIFDITALMDMINKSYIEKFTLFIKEKYNNELNQIVLF